MKRNNHVNRFCCSMYYPGMQLMKVKEDAAPLTYTGAFDFVSSTIGEPASRQYDYDNDGSLSWDANKGIALITYDRYSMPMSLQFTNGNTTEYVHSATGEKLKAVHRTAVPNISVPVGSTVALDASSTLSVDSTTYAGDFVFENGQLSKYLFDGGYATFANGQPAWHYYYRDHLGNVRAVVSHDGTVEQRNHYYPFGAVYGDVAYNDGLQKYKYNGKELDRMHGLNFYDYGARQYDPLLGMFTQMDPLAEKYYGISPYAYCKNNPANKIDPNGKDDYYTNEGLFLFTDNKKTDNLVILNEQIFNLKRITHAEWLNPHIPIEEITLTAKAYSNIFTDILSKMKDVDINDLYNGRVSVTVWKDTNTNLPTEIGDRYNDANYTLGRNADVRIANDGKAVITAYIPLKNSDENGIYSTKSNVQNLLGAHEYLGHFKHRWRDHDSVYPFQKKHWSWNQTSNFFKDYMKQIYE